MPKSAFSVFHFISFYFIHKCQYVILKNTIIINRTKVKLALETPVRQQNQCSNVSKKIICDMQK